MDKLLITAISTGLTTGLAMLAVLKSLQFCENRFERKLKAAEDKYDNVQNLDFTDHGSIWSLVGGLLIFISYLLVCLWMYFETNDWLLTLLPVLMFLWFGILGGIGILSPFLKKVEFKGELMIYRDFVGTDFMLKKEQIRSVEIHRLFIVIETIERKFSVSSEFSNPEKIYVKLMKWKAKTSGGYSKVSED